MGAQGLEERGKEGVVLGTPISLDYGATTSRPRYLVLVAKYHTAADREIDVYCPRGRYSLLRIQGLSDTGESANKGGRREVGRKDGDNM